MLWYFVGLLIALALIYGGAVFVTWVNRPGDGIGTAPPWPIPASPRSKGESK
jgi:hypothetical protein